MEIIAGYVGEPHVTSQQERNTNIAIFGDGTYILKGVNSELEATVVSANLVEISDGMIVCEGCTAEIPRGTNDSLVIENGEQGMKRIDLIVARYTRDANTAAESMELAVIKGTSAASDPVVPSHNTGTIADGDSPVDFPIYQVNIDGISITSVTMIADLSSVENDIATLQKLSIKAVQIDFASQGFDATGVIDRSMNVAQYIPSGYKLLTVLPLHSGSRNAVIYGCAVTGANVIRIQVRRLVDTLATTEAHATILCVNRDMV